MLSRCLKWSLELALYVCFHLPFCDYTLVNISGSYPIVLYISSCTGITNAFFINWIVLLDKFTEEQLILDADDEYQYEEVPIDDDFVSQGKKVPILTFGIISSKVFRYFSYHQNYNWIMVMKQVWSKICMNAYYPTMSNIFHFIGIKLCWVYFHLRSYQSFKSTDTKWKKKYTMKHSMEEISIVFIVLGLQA